MESFYALLSLGLAVIFGLLGVVNFAHGAFYMLGAFAAYIGLQFFGVNYWCALHPRAAGGGAAGDPHRALVSAAFVSARSAVRTAPDVRHRVDRRGESCAACSALPANPIRCRNCLQGGFNLGFMVLPIYRAWVVLASLTVCGMTWFLIERTRLGATLRAATENARLVQAFGINVPLMVMSTYGAGVALAALAGVLAAPVVQVSPLMGSSLVIVVFAVVVIGGMGSIIGAIVSGLALGLIEGFTKVIYPEASNIVVFVIMAVVLIWRPTGLFGRE